MKKETWLDEYTIDHFFNYDSKKRKFEEKPLSEIKEIYETAKQLPSGSRICLATEIWLSSKGIEVQALKD